MTKDELITRARLAIGGLETIRAVRTLEAHARRQRFGGGASTVSTWRAAGGFIRVEETVGARRFARLVHEGRGDDSLLRDARIAPRNMLAHAEELDLALRDHSAPNGARLISSTAHFVLYAFDPATYLCTLVIDLQNGRRIELTDYRHVDGIFTPFTERHIPDNGGSGFEDRYVSVAYNVALPPDIFRLDDEV